MKTIEPITKKIPWYTLEMAKFYFLSEMPTFLNPPSLFNHPNSCTIYHKMHDFFDYFYKENNLREKGQGFAAIQIVEENK